MENGTDELAYLELLADKYPSIQAASTEIVYLNAELDLPKGTEHFISDIHGEFEAFRHVLKNGSGSIKRKIEDTFPEMMRHERRTLASLIYYPEEKLPYILPDIEDKEGWFRQTLLRLIKLCRVVASKYTRTRVRQFLPDTFTDLIDELLHQQNDVRNKKDYYQSIIETIIATDSAPDFIVALSELIQTLAIDRLHVIGDVYDRGPGAHLIMDTLMAHHNLDFQWGNHDIVWMAAAAGSEACMANVIRISLRYANMETLETGYAISLLPLVSFAISTYEDDPCAFFMPKVAGHEEFTEHEIRLMAQMQKAIAIIQLKLEGQIVKRRPFFDMQDRLLLDKINFEDGTVTLGDTVYPMRDTNFPTIDPANPYELTEWETSVVERLKLSFITSKRLQQHVRFLYSKGSMYQVHNDNLLYHGCIPLEDDGSFMAFTIDDEAYSGKAYMIFLDRLVRQAYFATDDPAQKEFGLDIMWYLWSGPISPLFGKDKMATFERYFIADASTHVEKRNAYYELRDRSDVAARILREFGLDPKAARIINGHVPVKVRKGESPVKAGGKLLVIDGGFSKAYQKQTGIAGYTLVYNSYKLVLAAHHPFESTQKAIEEGLDIESDTEVLETRATRLRVRDTDKGRDMQRHIEDLQRLLKAYRTGLIKEQ